MNDNDEPPAVPTEAHGIPVEIGRAIIADDSYGRVVVDGEGYVRFANRAAAELLGRTVEDLIGAFLLDHVAPEDLPLAAEGILELQDRVPRAAEGIAMVFGLTRPDGSVAHVEVGSDNYLDVEGLEVVTLRLRPYDSQYHLQRFLQSMLVAGGSVADYGQLVSSVDHLVQQAVSALGSQWDGACFTDIVSHHLPPLLCGAVPVADSPGDDGVEPPWIEALGSGAICWSPTDRLHPELRAAAEALDLACVWATPVPATPGETPDSAIIVWRRVLGPPKIGHREGLVRAARAAALAFERTQQQRELLQAATLDPLTGLPNRAEFFAALTDEAHAPTAVLYLDLDGFKAVNDVLGHRFGDHLLREVAEVLAEVAEPGVLLARLGGDEFGLLVKEPWQADELTQLAERLVERFTRPFAVDGQSIPLGLSVGIADGSAGLRGEALLDAADRALYQVKRNGKGGWALAPSP